MFDVLPKCSGPKLLTKKRYIHNLSLQLSIWIIGTLLLSEVNSTRLNFFISYIHRNNNAITKLQKHLIFPKGPIEMRSFRIFNKCYATNKQSLQSRIIPGVSALISRNLNSSQHNEEEYLIVQRGKLPSYGKWSFPGGKVEFGESLLEAIKREIQEELHLKKSDVIFTKYPFMNTDAFWTDSQSKTQTQFIIFQFYARVSDVQQKQQSMMADDDILDFKWQTKSQISQLTNSNLTVGELIEVIETSEKLKPYLIEIMEKEK